MTSPDLEAIVSELTEGERERLLFGRLDWRAGDWQDHCGDPNCEDCSGLIPDPEPRRLSAQDQQVRAYLQKEQGK